MGGRSGLRRDITPGQARLVTARFVLRQLLYFFLAEVPHFKHLVSTNYSILIESLMVRNNKYRCNYHKPSMEINATSIQLNL